MKSKWKSKKQSEMKFKLNLNTIIRKNFSNLKKVKSISNQVTKCGDLFNEYFNKYFRTSIGSSDSILIHYWNSQKAEQSQSIILRPVTDIATQFHIEKQNLLGWIALGWQF